jgi:hypothetical protein
MRSIIELSIKELVNDNNAYSAQKMFGEAHNPALPSRKCFIIHYPFPRHLDNLTNELLFASSHCSNVKRVK